MIYNLDLINLKTSFVTSCNLVLSNPMDRIENRSHILSLLLKPKPQSKVPNCRSFLQRSTKIFIITLIKIFVEYCAQKVGCVMLHCEHWPWYDKGTVALLVLVFKHQYLNVNPNGGSYFGALLFLVHFLSKITYYWNS